MQKTTTATTISFNWKQKEALYELDDCIAIYHDDEYNPYHTDIEVAYSIAQDFKATRILKGGQCAMLIHKGSYTNLPDTYAALTQWIETNGFSVSLPPYEKYVIGPDCEKPASEWITEVYFPIEKK